MSEIRNRRRYCLRKRQAYDARDEESGYWKGKQEAEPGTALPADFPFLSELEELGYTTEPDLDGADADELVRLGMRARDAETVIEAFEALE
jgi:hypothetical protein